jgi:hypothetical protein
LNKPALFITLIKITNMSGLTEIQEAIIRLDPAELAQLRAWITTYDPALEREWAAEARERLHEVRSGAVSPVDGDEALAQMRRIVSG